MNLGRLSLKFCVGLLVLAFGVVAAFPRQSIAAPQSDEGGTHRVVGYFIEWGIYGRSYFVKNVATSGSASKLTHLNYAFANAAPDNPTAGGQVKCQLFDPWADFERPTAAEESVDGVAVPWGAALRGNFQQLKALKALYPKLKVLMSIGGWTGSKYFSDAALTAESRQAFVQSCIDMFIKGNLPLDTANSAGGPGSAWGVFDGFDLDWEWPGSDGNTGNIIRPEDKQNFTLLVREFRKQLDALSKQTHQDYKLTAFLPAARSKIDAGFEVKKLFQNGLNFATVQGYDLHGTWESSTNHQANLLTSSRDPSNPAFSVDDTVKAYLERGAPASKIVIGVPFYSRGWTGVPSTNNGLYQTSTGAAPGTWEAGNEDYKVLKAKLAAGEYVRYWDNRSKEAWLYNGTNFWTFDDPQVMKEKAKYVLKHDLGGIMFWDITSDTADGELITAISKGLHN